MEEGRKGGRRKDMYGGIILIDGRKGPGEGRGKEGGREKKL